jgi:GntR family transcriptional regulator
LTVPYQLGIDKRRKLAPYRQILEQLRAAILAGNLSPGEKLPSVREMARNLKVNPLTVARAVNELESAGLVESRWGKGSFVLTIPNTRRKKERIKALKNAAREFSSRSRQLGFGIEEAARMLHSLAES